VQLTCNTSWHVPAVAQHAPVLTGGVNVMLSLGRWLAVEALRLANRRADDAVDSVAALPFKIHPKFVAGEFSQP